MKKLITLLFTVLSTISFAQTSYSRVKVFADALELKRLGDLGVTVDHGTYKEGVFFISDFSNLEIAIMNENNFDYEVLIEDVQAYYIEHMSDPSGYVPKNATCAGGNGGSSGFNPATPTNFNQGTMGGYLKYNEMLAELDQMATLYPNLPQKRLFRHFFLVKIAQFILCECPTTQIQMKVQRRKYFILRFTMHVNQ